PKGTATVAPREQVRFDDLPSALAATIADPGRIELIAADDLPTVGAWLAGRDSVGASIVFDDPRPRRGTALAFAIAGSDGRVIAAGPEIAGELRELVEARAIALVAHEAKP